MDERNERFLINKLRDIVKTDDGYCLQEAYYKNENGEIVETEEHKKHKNKNHWSKNCHRCIHESANHCLFRAKLANLPENRFIPYTWVANCDAYEPVHPLNIIKSEDEMIQFIERAENFFNSPESYEAYFGFERKWDEATGEILETVKEYYDRGGKFTSIPDRFPCVIYFGVVDFDAGRLCDEQLNWIYLD